MRESKFKAIRKDNGKWVCGDLVHHYSIKNGERTGHVSIGIDLDFYEVISETICQFTTLKDKNGVKIFEGDIFIYQKHYGYIINDFIGVVGFKDGSFGYYVYFKYVKNAKTFTPFSKFDELQEDLLSHIEIICSIHDNAHQKQALINMIRLDEELGLYDNKPKNH